MSPDHTDSARGRGLLFLALALAFLALAGALVALALRAPEPAPLMAQDELRGAPIDAAPGMPGEDASRAVAPPPSGATAPAPSNGSAPGPHGASGHPGLVPSTQLGAAVEVAGESYRMITFVDLAAFEAPLAGLRPTGDPDQRAGMVPASVRALAGQHLAVQGFMMPYETEGGRVKTFYLMPSVAGCCFGAMPRINEVIEVHMTKPVPAANQTPVVVAGLLAVNEVIAEFGTLICLYTFEGHGVLDPAGLR